MKKAVVLFYRRACAADAGGVRAVVDVVVEESLLSGQRRQMPSPTERRREIKREGRSNGALNEFLDTAVD